MEYINVHRTFFIEKKFFSVFIGVCGQFWRATENATKKNFAVALSHSTFALEIKNRSLTNLHLQLHSHTRYAPTRATRTHTQVHS